MNTAELLTQLPLVAPLPPRGQMLDPVVVVTFALAGNARMTLVSKATGTRFTYKISQCDDKEGLWFVSLLRGPDNEADYQYLGTIRENSSDKYTRYVYAQGLKSRVSREAPSARGFDWAWGYLGRRRGLEIPPSLEIWHEGRCGRCNRRLTVPESVARGLGPECAGVV
jgi:hypothetical protein